MPRIKAPTPTEPTAEDPKVDMSPLIADLVSALGEREEAEGKLENTNVAIVQTIVAFHDENPEMERTDAKLAIQTAVSQKTGLKLAQVQTAPRKDEKCPADKNLGLTGPEVKSKRLSASSLVSTLLSMAWPAHEDQYKKTRKLLAEGEDRFIVLQSASRKPNKRGQATASSNTITRENLVEKFSKFMTKVETDLPAPTSEVLDLLYAAIETIQKTLAQPE